MIKMIEQIKRFFSVLKKKSEEYRARELERLDEQIEKEKERNIIFEKRKELNRLRNKRLN
jgi:hypothetical protein